MWDQQSLANSLSTIALTHLVVTDCIIQNHPTSNVSNLTSVLPPTSTDPSSIIVDNGSSLLVTSVGDSALSNLFYLNNVLITLDIIQNLLSDRRFTTYN
jgi:hypothetical protein